MAGLNDVAKQAGLNPVDAGDGRKVPTNDVLQKFFDLILEKCANGESVRITGFGTFKARIHKGRTLKSPLLENGEITFEDALVLRFTSSAVAKRKLNVNFTPGDTLGESTPKKDTAKKSKTTAKKGAAKKTSKKSKKGKTTAKKDTNEAETQAKAS